MATVVLPRQRTYADRWEDCYSSAVLSGIGGDKAHAARGGYHMSIQDNPPNNYSVTRPDDKAPPGTWRRDIPAATDMSMNPTDMATDYRRVRAVFDDRSDPRRKYLNAYNGYRGTGTAQRLDFVTNTITEATADHRWHAHEERKRRYVEDPVADDACLSIHRGETKAQYVARVGAGGSTITTGVPMTPADLAAALNDSTVRARLQEIVKTVATGFSPTTPQGHTLGALMLGASQGHAATQAALAAAEAREVARDAAQDALLRELIERSGAQISPAQFAEIKEAMATAAREAGEANQAAVLERLERQEAAREEALRAELGALTETTGPA